MSKNQKVLVRNNFDREITLWLEPWGADYGMEPNDEFEIIEEDASDDFYFYIVFNKDNDIIIYLEGVKASYPIIKQNDKELSCGHNRVEK